MDSIKLTRTLYDFYNVSGRLNFFKKCVVFFVLVLCAVSGQAAEKKKELRIAAVVDNEAISTLDVQERMQIIMFSSNLPRGKDIEEKLMPQVLRNLIDERIFMKEAHRLGIEVTKEELDSVIADIEKRNNIQPGKFKIFLENAGVKSEAMIEQIRSQLTWSKVVSRTIRPRIVITDKEIEEKIENIKNQAGAGEVNLSEILLPVDAKNDDKRIKELATKLSSQLGSGADFAKIAKQFSRSPTAENGGNIGWISIGQLPAEVVSALNNMKPGATSKPIRVTEGYIIFRMNDKHDASQNKYRDDDKELRNKVRENSILKKLETEANSYLRELRRSSFVEIKT